MFSAVLINSYGTINPNPIISAHRHPLYSMKINEESIWKTKRDWIKKSDY